MTSRTSRGPPAKTRGRDGVARGAVPASATPSSDDGDEVGGRARRDPAAAGPAEARVAARGRGLEQLRRRCGRRARRVARRSSSSIARASSNRSMTACESLPTRQRRAGLAQPPRRADAVGEVALGRRAQAARRARAAEQRDVVVGQVRRVHRGEALGERAGVGEQSPSASAPCASRHASFSAGCSETCACSGAPRSRRPRRDHASPTPGRPRARCGSPRRSRSAGAVAQLASTRAAQRVGVARRGSCVAARRAGSTRRAA